MTQSGHIKLIEEYNALRAELDAAREEMKATLEKLSVQMERNSALENEVASLKDQLYWLRKKVFGKMSEKNLPVDPMQLNLFETEPMSEEEQAELRKAVEQQKQTITRTITVSKPARKAIDTTRLPVEEIDIYPDGTTTPDGSLKDEYVEIGTEETLRMETMPARVYVVKTIRHKVMLRSDVANRNPEDRRIMTPEQRLALRKEESYPVIRVFERWMQASYPKVSLQSRMGRAIAYTYSLLPRLSRYVNDGRINIDNNLIENAIRPLALGRKNYLFCGNDASAYRAAIVYSLIGTCKAAGVEPRLWMEDVLRQIPYYERDGRDMSDLLPREWVKRKE